MGRFRAEFAPPLAESGPISSGIGPQIGPTQVGSRPRRLSKSTPKFGRNRPMWGPGQVWWKLAIAGQNSAKLGPKLVDPGLRVSDSEANGKHTATGQERQRPHLGRTALAGDSDRNRRPTTLMPNFSSQTSCHKFAVARQASRPRAARPRCCTSAHHTVSRHASAAWAAVTILSAT